MEKEEIILQLKKAQEIINRCVAALDTGKVNTTKPTKKLIAAVARSTKIDFTLNYRNFVKIYGKGLNGQKKFVLLLAYNTKGKVGADVEKAAIQSAWSKMTAKELLGYAYNDKYPTAAKTNGWIDSNKHGTYHLRDTWMEIFS